MCNQLMDIAIFDWDDAFDDILLILAGRCNSQTRAAAERLKGTV